MFIDNQLFTRIVNSTMKVNSAATGILLDALGDFPGLDWAAFEKSYTVTVLWAKDGWPAEVRATIASIPDPWPATLIVVARSFSPGALDLLRQRGANWVDEAGNVSLQIPPGLFIAKVASSQGKKSKSAFSWSPSSIAIAEQVLCSGGSSIDLQDLAATTGWSVPQASNVLRAFDEKEWTTRHGPARGRGVWRGLANPGALLEAWSASLIENRPQRHLGHKLMRDPIRFLSEELAPALDKLGDWAVTGWAGLELVAPFVSVVPSLQMYVPTSQFRHDTAALFRQAGIREVEEGANIEIWEMDLPLLVASKGARGIPVINSPRLYADLLAIGGRAIDGAEHLREIELEY